MEFKIANKVITDKTTVFYVFDNGEVNSNHFDNSVSDEYINKWGIDRAKFFEDRLIQPEEIVEDDNDNN